MSTPNHDSNNLALFWYWVLERHLIHTRRQGGMEPPWTDDDVMASYSFTNVYRELYPGTVFIADMLRDGQARERPLAEAVMNALAYRLAFHEGSMRALGWLPTGGEFMDHAPTLCSRLRDHPKPFTGAYVVSNYGRKGPKVDVVMGVLTDIATALDGHRWAHTLRAAEMGKLSRADWLTQVQTLYGIGPFVAFQATVDLAYPLGAFPPWLEHMGNDGYALAGPGALRGLKLLFPESRPAVADSLLEWLAANQGHTGLDYISRANLQNCCCEFSKYHKALATGGRNLRRRFDSRISHFNDKVARGHLKQLDLELP